ncbi:hypothetical protein ACFZAM_31495 [Streptomyces sp. NPDC008079]|uniref:hypothetical protein n=1 Tax=Streptomyces sp. NPDC008079 TaxID=3364806 RepID=UPI0036E1E8A4
MTVKVYAANYSAGTLAANIRAGRLAYAPRGFFEARTRTVEDGTEVQVRYVGTAVAS